MFPDRILARLTDHHEEIERCLRDGGQLLVAGDASRLKALALVRWQLIRALRAYQLFKHAELFDPLIASAAGPRRMHAAELKRRCLRMGDLYADHVARWGLGAALQAWPDYLRDADAMVRRIRRHLGEEAVGIRLLLAGLDRVRHAVPADHG